MKQRDTWRQSYISCYHFFKNLLMVFIAHYRKSLQIGCLNVHKHNICYRGYTIKMHKHAHFVITIWRLGEVETQQVVCFGTVLPVTHHQLASLSAAETEVLMCVFALWPQLPFLRLQLGVPGFLLLLHHHCTLDQTSQKEWNQTQLPKVWTALETGSRRSMSSPLAAPRGIRSSCLTHSYKMFSCCPHSGGCS